jgi:hypothetical protein
MKILFLILSAFGAPNIDPAVIGTWKYVAYNFDGHTQPRPNLDLDLRFTFRNDGTSDLTWHYDNEEGFCERTAQFQTQSDGWIYQKVTWVNTANHISCSRDADMQMGRESVTSYEVTGDKLMFKLELNGQPFIYILELITKGTK